MKKPQGLALPDHPPRNYAPVGQCIYCGSEEQLTREHIIPYSAGGQWILPDASCRDCAALTGAFEGEVSRTILGPLRMLYNLPTRRPNDRPDHLPLKVKYPHSSDWEIVHVDRRICPFLILLPLYPMPDALTETVTEGRRDSTTANIWICGGGFWQDRNLQLEWLCNVLGASEVMPEGTVHTEPFCLMLAKIAHSFAVAELGMDGIDPFLTDMIRHRDVSNRAEFIGGGEGNEPPSNDLHELAFDSAVTSKSNVIAVRIRLLGILGTPTYHVAVGRSI